MTASTKMTEEKANRIIQYCRKSCCHPDCSKARYFLEGLQAGRAEMAEEITKALKDYTCPWSGDSSHWVNVDPLINRIAQRDGGKRGESMSNDERIDLSYEGSKVALNFLSGRIDASGIIEWAKSISERVESQTIERCLRWCQDDHFQPDSLPRIYSQPEVKGAQNVEGE